MSHDFSTVREFQLGAYGRLFIAPTGTRDLVIVEGSVFGGPNMLPREQDVLPALAASLLDAGTAKKSKDAIREGLAGKGIALSFGATGDRTLFSGQCFPEQLATLLGVIVECLRGAAFPDAEVKNAKKLALGALAEERTHTRAQAERALAALVYDPSHVQYMRSTREEEQSVAVLRRADLEAFRTRLGQGGLVLVIAGDVRISTARAIAEKAFGTLGVGTTAPSAKHLNTKLPRAAEKLIPIPDKANIDVLFGASVPVTLEHELYHALRIVAEMLGGGAFSSHLMRTIRDREGLTYAIAASLVGVKPDTDGCFKIWANFTPNKFKESVDKVHVEVGVFLREGMTAAALEETKERMTGSYAVSLATTRNLSAALHTIGIQGRPFTYLAEYPEIVRQVTLAEVQAAAALVPFDKLAVAAAGTFKKN
jgi:zinc protease